MAGTIYAYPNPVPLHNGIGTTTVSWNTHSGSVGKIFVSENGGEEKFLAEGTNGAVDIPWIQEDAIYEFRLYNGSEQKTLIDTMAVRGGDGSGFGMPLEAVVDGLLQYAASEEHRDLVAQALGKVLNPFVNSKDYYEKYFHLWEDQGIHVTPNHFYFPIPDTRTLPEDLWEKESALAGVDMNVMGQLEFLQKHFPKFQDEYNNLPTAPTSIPYEFHLNNRLFDGTDALVLYCMVRHYQPRTIIEVGSGYSSLVSAQAARKNGSTDLICIEPYPNEFIQKGFPGLKTLLVNKVQEIDLDFFQQLGPGDVLFVDTAHVVTIGGDVNYLFLEVIPRLRPGVIVHVHDIRFPREYRRDWVMDEMRFWNEQYLLQAFLAFNSEFEVLFSNSYMAFKHLEEFQKTFPHSPWYEGGSIWMRRKD